MEGVYGVLLYQVTKYDTPALILLIEAMSTALKAKLVAS
jgi:hypothetical protein